MLFFWNILHTREMNDTIHKSLYTTPLHTIQIIGSLRKIFFFFSSANNDENSSDSGSSDANSSDSSTPQTKAKKKKQAGTKQVRSNPF